MKKFILLSIASLVMLLTGCNLFEKDLSGKYKLANTEHLFESQIQHHSIVEVSKIDRTTYLVNFPNNDNQQFICKRAGNFLSQEGFGTFILKFSDDLKTLDLQIDGDKYFYEKEND